MTSLPNEAEDQLFSSPTIDRLLTEIAQIIYKCKFCDFITDEKLSIISHYRSTHAKPVEAAPSEAEESDERFVCSLCFSIFLTREIVKEHMIEDHGCVPMGNESNQTQMQVTQSQDNDFVNGKKDVEKEILRPISLRDLQLKLKSSFVIK